MRFQIKKSFIFISIFVFSISAFSMGETPKKWNFSLTEHPEISLYNFCSENSPNTSIYYEEGESKRREVPPLKPERTLGEALSGAALGVAGLYGGFFIGGGFGDYFLPPLDAIIFGITGWALGSSLGIYIIGSIGNQTGSYLATIAGSVLGGLAGGALGYFSLYLIPLGDLFVLSPFIGSVVGGIIGFNLTRRYKSSGLSEKSLINFNNGKMKLGFPQITFRPNPFVRGNLIHTVNLVSVSF